MKNKFIIFDLDDTLIECGIYYKENKNTFVQQMISLFPGETVESIMEKQSERDMALMPSLGLDCSRYALSLVQTYKSFCEQYEAAIDIDKCNAFFELGMSIFKIVPALKEETISILKDLDKNNIYLLTAGSLSTQWKKLNDTGLDQYFKKENVFIFERKRKQEMQVVINKIKMDHPGSTTDNMFMVGDSFATDIKAATSSKVHAIHIKRNDSWDFAKEPEKDFATCHSLYEVINYIKNYNK